MSYKPPSITHISTKMDSLDVASVVLPNDLDAVPSLVSDISAKGETLAQTKDATLIPRLELLAKVRELERALQTPREMMIQHLWAEARPPFRCMSMVSG
jgi:hypothetical protein